MFTPSLFIGAGGVGKNILYRIRRMMVERYQALDAVPSVKFLHLDTDISTNSDGNAEIPMHVLGEHIAFAPAERIELSREISRQIQNGAHSIRTNPAIQEWFFDQLPLDVNFKEGAGGVRSYGRLAFHFSVLPFRTMVRTLLLSISEQNNKNTSARTLGDRPDLTVNVYIVCSLLGGTGSGSFLEIAYNLREAIAASGLTAKTFGFFVIGGSPDNVTKVNGYSALKELEYFATLSQKGGTGFQVQYPVPGVPSLNRTEAPVDICYLVGAVNEQGQPFNRNQLEEIIALNLFMEFASGVAEAKRSKRVDIIARTPGFFTLDGKLGRSQQFFTFGLSVLEFPAPRIQEMLAHQAAAALATGWMFDQATGGANPAGAVRDFLKENRLEEKEFIDDLLSIGGQRLLAEAEAQLQNQEQDLNQLIGAAHFDRPSLLATALGHIEMNVRAVAYSTDPKLCGPLTATILATAEKKISQVNAALRKRTSELISNEHQGPAAALKFLQALLNDLTGKAQMYDRHLGSLEKSCLQARQTVQGEAMILFERNCQPSFQSELRYINTRLHKTYLREFVTKTLRCEAYRAAVRILRQDWIEQGELVLCLLEQVNRLIAEVEGYRQTLKDFSDHFYTEARQIEQTLMNNPIAGSLSLTRERLYQLGQEVVPNPAVHLVPALNRIEALLGEKNSLGELIRPFPIFEAVRTQPDLVKRALLRACGDICERARRISIARELMRLEDRHAIISQRFQQSGVLLQLTGLDTTVGHDPENSRREWLATASPESDPDLPAIVSEILQVHPYSLTVPTLTDPYQIVFAEEKGVFPLRCIRELQEYKRIYDEFNRHPNAIPRETDRRISFPDVVPESPLLGEINHRAEVALLLGKLFGFLVEQTNPQTEYRHIYLTYFDPSNRAQINCELSATWDSVITSLTVQQIRKTIDRQPIGETCLEKIEALLIEIGSQANTKSRREALWIRLQDHLAALEGSVPGGTLNQVYTHDLDIISRYRAQFRLSPPTIETSLPVDSMGGTQIFGAPVANRSPGTSPLPKPTAQPPSGELFRRLVQEFLRLNQMLSPIQRKVLESKRSACGLSIEEAETIIRECSLPVVTSAVLEYTFFLIAMYDGTESPFEAAREILEDEQHRLGLPTAMARSTERAVQEYAEHCVAFFPLTNTEFVRGELKQKQCELNLTDEVVREIEAHISSLKRFHRAETTVL